MEAVKEESLRRGRTLPDLGEMDEGNEQTFNVEDDYKSTISGRNDSTIGTTVSSWTVKTSPSVRAFLDDDPSEMTYQRRLALYLMKKKWYNPQYDPKDDEENDSDHDDDTATGSFTVRYPKPSLAKAWAYFEHSTLQRYVVEEDDEGDDDYHAGGSGNLPRRELRRGVSQARGISQRFYDGFLSRRGSTFTVDTPHDPAPKTKLFDPIGTQHSQVSSWKAVTPIDLKKST